MKHGDAHAAMPADLVSSGRRELPAFDPLRMAGLLLATTLIGVFAWAALAPIAPASRDELFEIPPGTWARRVAGDKVEILPSTIGLTLGANDVLVLKNLDAVPQVFGPVLIMPGQSFRLPFEVASTYNFACTAHASGQMSVIVDPHPAAGWDRLRWRIKQWTRRPPWRQEAAQEKKQDKAEAG